MTPNTADALCYFARLPEIQARSAQRAKKTAETADQLIIELLSHPRNTATRQHCAKGPAVAPAHGTVQKGPAVWF